MTERDGEKSFDTLREFVRGEDSDEPMYFAFSATLRIHGDDLPLDEITRRLQVQPTRAHRNGDRPKPAAKNVGCVTL